MNPLLAPIEIPAKLAQRAIRDLEAIGDVARSVPRAIALLESLDQKATQLIEWGERIDARGAELLEMGAEVNDVGVQILAEARLVQERAGEVVDRANAMIAVIPTVERALEIGQPLEGAIDRIGRVVDRLPGGAAAGRVGKTLDAGSQPEPNPRAD